MKSTYEMDAYAQKDGRRWIRERHETDAKQVFRVEYLAPVKWNADAALADRAARITAWLADAPVREKELQRQEFDGLLEFLKVAPEHTALTTYKTYLETEKTSLEAASGDDISR